MDNNGNVDNYLLTLIEIQSSAYGGIVNYYMRGNKMDKQEAIKRLDALEGEAKKLREIIEKGDKLIYDSSKIYVGILCGLPLIMTGRGVGEGEDFCFQSFADRRPALMRWTDIKPTGQECLDYHLAAGFDIHVFDDTREAFQFFLDNLK